MLFDNIILLNGSKIENVVVDSGASFPTSPDAGELFFKTSDSKLYVYDGTAWNEVGSGSGGGSFTVTGDATGTLENGSGALTLATVNTNVGNYGSASSVPTFSVNTKGLITAAAQTSISITPSQISSTVPVSKGGTGQTTASAAINALVPSQAASPGRFLMTDGSSVSWQVPAGGTVSSVDISGGSTGLTVAGGPITTSGTLTLGGVLGVAAGGTGQSTAAGAIAALLPNQTVHGGKFLQTNGTVTSWATISSSNVTSALGYTPVSKAGDTMTGPLVLSDNPTLDMHAATKQYVDNVAAGINVLGACRTATTAELSATYSNGSSGVGATLTGTAALPSIGSITLSTSQRVLVKNQTDQKQNGIYVVTSASNPWVLTRATDYDGRFPGTIDAGDTVFVQEGDLAGTLWVQNTTGQLTVGTSNLSWTQFSGPGSYSAGTGIGLSNNVISNAGVLSVTAGANTSVSAATGAITVGFSGTLPVASGGTGQTTLQDALNSLAGGVTANRVLRGDGTNVALGTLDLSTDGFTGTLPVARGGTGVTSTTAIATAILPSQTDNSGKFLMTTGAGLQWVGISVEGSGGALQFNNNGQFDGTSQISYNATDTLTVGAAAGTFNIIGATESSGLTILGGVTEGGMTADPVVPRSSTLTLQGGRANDKMVNGTAQPSKAGGDVVIAGGISASSFGGSVIIKTAASNSLTERLKIDSTGTWYVSGTAGTAGYVLTSGGPGVAPSWTIPPAVTSINISGGTTGLTATGGPITTSGTLTLGGTLAISAGGTGQTTAAAAINALLPTQTGNTGRFLTTDGTNASWVAAQGTGSVTSVNASGGTTGLTFSGGPIDAAGTLTLGGTLSIASGGTGQTTAQGALNALAGGVTANRVLVGNGTNVALGTLSLSSDTFTGTLPVARGGTGQTTASGAINAMVPSQSGKIGQYLTTNGTEVSWATISSVAAAGEQGDIQFNDSGVTAANSALKLIGDNLTATKDMSVNGMTVGAGSGTGTINKNTALGYGVLGGSSQAVRNAGVGYSALAGIVHGSDNVAVGYSAASSIETVSGNVAIGSEALSLNRLGSNNVAVGYRAIKGTQPVSGAVSGSNNVAVGSEAFSSNISGSTNVAIGSSALNKTTTGDGNVAVGSSALINNTTASNSTGIGKNSLYSSYGAGNTAVGYESLYGNTAGANNVAIGAGAGGDLTTGDDNTIIGCHRGEVSLARTVIISAGTLQRLRFNSDGALELTEDSGYGSSGQVLTSNGSAAAPSWSTPTTGTVTSVSGSGGSTGLTLSGGPITSSGTLTLGGTLGIANGGTGQTTASGAINALVPSQTGNGGKYLTTDGSAVSWAAVPSAGTLENSTTLGTSSAAVSITGFTSTSSGGAPMTISAGTTSAGNGNSLTLSGGAAASANTGGAVVIRSGDSGASGGAAGSLTVHADSSYGGGSVTVRGGDSAGNGTVGASANGGSLTLRGGDSTNGSAGSTPGNVDIRGGNAAATTSGGSVTISGGTGPAGGGTVIFQTAETSSLTERLRIANNGAWGLAGANYGTSGQVLTSNGSGSAPTWQSTASAALPSQTGNSGKYLTTDGTTASWATVSASLSGVSAFGASYNEVDSTITASSTTSIDCSLSNNFSISMAASISTLSFTNVPASGRLYCATLFLVQDSAGSKTVNWPASFRWSGGSAPTLTTTGSKTDIITIVTRDGGTTWFAMTAGQNF